MEEFFSAKEARQMMDINNATILREQLSIIFRSIKEQVNRGLDSVYIDTHKIPEFYSNSKALTNALENLGYEVNHYSSQRDGSSLYIKW